VLRWLSSLTRPDALPEPTSSCQSASTSEALITGSSHLLTWTGQPRLTDTVSTQAPGELKHDVLTGPCSSITKQLEMQDWAPSFHVPRTCNPPSCGSSQPDHLAPKLPLSCHPNVSASVALLGRNQGLPQSPNSMADVVLADHTAPVWCSQQIPAGMRGDLAAVLWLSPTIPHRL